MNENIKFEKLDHKHLNKFYYCPICMQYQYPDKENKKYER